MNEEEKNEEEKNEDYQIEEEQKESVPKITAIEPKETVNDWLTDFGADLANSILGKMQDKHDSIGSKDQHRGTDATECIMFAQQLENSLCIGDVLSGISILDAEWLAGLRQFLGEIKVPDSFGQEQMNELMVLLRCIEYHGLALMQADVRDRIVDSLMSLSDEIELAAYRAQSR